jgi:hypothetical protein
VCLITLNPGAVWPSNRKQIIQKGSAVWWVKYDRKRQALPAETFDSGDNEFGMERVQQILYASGKKDLRYISTEIRARALAHGEQRDDQTILVIRRLR